MNEYTQASLFSVVRDPLDPGKVDEVSAINEDTPTSQLSGALDPPDLGKFEEGLCHH